MHASESSSFFAPLVPDAGTETPPTAEPSPVRLAPETTAADACSHETVGARAAELPADAALNQVLLTALVARLVALSVRFKSNRAADGTAREWSPKTALAVIRSWVTRFGCPLWWIWNVVAMAERREDRKIGREGVSSDGYIGNTLLTMSKGLSHPGEPPPLKDLEPWLDPTRKPVRASPATDSGEVNRNAGPDRKTREAEAAAERAREQRLRCAWGRLPETERESIRAAVRAENPALAPWPNILEPLYLVALEARMADPAKAVDHAP